MTRERKVVSTEIKNNQGRRIARAIGAVENNELEVVAVHVQENFRRQGIGSKLIERLGETGKELGAQRISGELLPSCGATRNEVEKFWRKNGFKVKEDGRIFGDL